MLSALAAVGPATPRPAEASCVEAMIAAVQFVKDFVRRRPNLQGIASQMRSDLESTLGALPAALDSMSEATGALRDIQNSGLPPTEFRQLRAEVREVLEVWRDVDAVAEFEAELLQRAVASGNLNFSGVIRELEVMAVELNGGRKLAFAPTDRGRTLSVETVFGLVQRGPFVDGASINGTPVSAGGSLIFDRIRPHGSHSHLYQWVYLARSFGAKRVSALWRVLATGVLGSGPGGGPDGAYERLWTAIFDMPNMRHDGPLGPYWPQQRLLSLGALLEIEN